MSKLDRADSSLRDMIVDNSMVTVFDKDRFYITDLRDLMKSANTQLPEEIMDAL